MKEVRTGGRDPGEGGLHKCRINSQIELCNNIFEEKVLHVPNLSTYHRSMTFKSKLEQVNFYNAALGYPTIACMVAALRSHLQLPGISIQIQQASVHQQASTHARRRVASSIETTPARAAK